MLCRLATNKAALFHDLFCAVVNKLKYDADYDFINEVRVVDKNGWVSTTKIFPLRNFC